MNFDSIFWFASCTKLVAGIAAMQLIERGILALDDADQVEALCPELKSVRILTHVDDKKTPIMLRMLLTHTDKFSIILKRNPLLLSSSMKSTDNVVFQLGLIT